MSSFANIIPDWNNLGVLPPIRLHLPGNSPDRSPYEADIELVVKRFATTNERKLILRNLLLFRSSLHEAGITSGFQWLNGSFMEHVELLEKRAPRDLDIVTFFEMPDNQTQALLLKKHGVLFQREHILEKYAIAIYYMVLSEPLDSKQVKNITYWYSMWSHQRNGIWKGFIQISLEPAFDKAAQSFLNHTGGDSYD